MKSNTNQVRAEVRKYILECLDLSGYDKPNTIKNMLEIYNDEFGAHNVKRYPNHQERFTEWLKGCPSALSVEMYYDEVRNILIDRFKTNTPAKRDDVKSFQYFLNLIYLEVKRMEEEPEKESAKLLKKIEKSFK
jgi:hypothetical protein